MRPTVGAATRMTEGGRAGPGRGVANDSGAGDIEHGAALRR
jgi:hypothetical protein